MERAHQDGQPASGPPPPAETSPVEREAARLASTAPAELAVDLPTGGMSSRLSRAQVASAWTWLGADLSDVRIVGGAHGQAVAGRSGASALTVGDDIFVNRNPRGAAAPDLAHEIAHVVQQRPGAAAGPIRQPLPADAAARQRLVPEVTVAGTEAQSAVLLNGGALVDCQGPLSDITVTTQVQGVAAWLRIEVRVGSRIQAALAPGAGDALNSAADGYLLVVVRRSPSGAEAGQDTEVARLTGGRQPAAAVGTPTAAAPSGRVPRLKQALAGEDSDVDTIAAELTDDEIAGLDLATRMATLRQVADGWVVGNEDENTLIRLVRLAPTDQGDAVLAGLRGGDSKLLQRLEKVIDFSDYRRYHLAVRDLSTRTMAATSGTEVQSTIQNAPVFPWSDTGLLKSMTNDRVVYDDVGFTASGKITFSYYITFWGLGQKFGPFVVDPLQIVGVKFFVDEEHEGAGAGQTLYLPAINLLELINKQTWQEYQFIGEAALLATGAGAVLGAPTKLRRAIALVDMAVGAAGIVLTDYRGEIGKSPAGQAFLTQWDRFMAVYAIIGGLRMVRELPTAYRALKNSWAEFRAAAGAKVSPDAAAEMEKQLANLEQRLGQATEDAAGVPDEALTKPKESLPGTTPTPTPSTAATTDYQAMPFQQLEALAVKADKKAIDELVRRNSLRMVEPEPSAAAKADLTYEQLLALERENAWAAQELGARTQRLDTTLKKYRTEQATKLVPGTQRPVGQRGAVGTLQSGSQTVGGTLAVAETDIPHLSKGFRGASPEAGGPKLPPQGKESPFSPDNPDPRGLGHAEERTLAALDQEVEAARKAGKLSGPDLEGRTVRMHVEDLPCSSCTAGIGHAHSSGPLVKFLEKYPGIRLVVTDAFSGQILLMSKAPNGAVLVVRQGTRTF